MANANPSPATRWKPGESGNPGGQPKGTPHLKTRIKEYLRDNPKVFEELVRYYIQDTSMRKLLWQMLEGKPKEETEISGGLNLSVHVYRDDGQEPERVTGVQR